MSTISVNCQFNKYDVNKISVKPEENCKRISGKDRKRQFDGLNYANYAPNYANKVRIISPLTPFA